MAEVYPWHAEHMAHIVRLTERDRLPHALLLRGPRHLGKLDFALTVAAFLLCRRPGPQGQCGECEECKLIAAGTHPDLKLISPEDSKLIRVEQIRDLIEWVAQTPQRGGARTVVIDPAEQMNVYSANALLKCLEEPGSNTVIMLVTDSPGRLLPTIRSRCQHLDFAIPKRDESIAWLNQMHSGEDNETLLSIAGGVPLAVTRELSGDFLARRSEIATAVTALVSGSSPIESARVLYGGDPETDLSIVYGIFADALRVALTGDKNLIKNKDLGQSVEAVLARVRGRSLFAAVDAIARARREATSSSNPNMQLLYESLAIQIARDCAL